ncbi:uncharacterized protein LOC119769846 [Culex quinquefasciatus]|uniref:uncharacterized protein LOC119769846 n=1 Tax=Culex quinquefasciatus TaxID=7176 RepID=UPI0018E393E0|nr:uncharacterized protein LOC119769846 [Culex quinquefasciatus]
MCFKTNSETKNGPLFCITVKQQASGTERSSDAVRGHGTDIFFRLYRKRRSDQPENQPSQREQRNSEQFARPLETPASAGGNSMTRSISSRLRIPKPSSTTILTVPVSSFLLRRKTCGRMSTTGNNQTPRFGSNDVHQVNLTPPTTTPRISPTGDVRNNPNGVKRFERLR